MTDVGTIIAILQQIELPKPYTKFKLSRGVSSSVVHIGYVRPTRGVVYEMVCVMQLEDYPKVIIKAPYLTELIDFRNPESFELFKRTMFKSICTLDHLPEFEFNLV